MRSIRRSAGLRNATPCAAPTACIWHRAWSWGSGSDESPVFACWDENLLDAARAEGLEVVTRTAGNALASKQ